MRKILMFTRNGIAAMSAIARRASFAAFGASLAVTLCNSNSVVAQTTAQQLAPTALMTTPYNQLVSGGVPANVSQTAGGVTTAAATVDASYSLLTDDSQVEQSAYFGGLSDLRSGVSPAAYCPPDPCNAGCDIRYYVNADALYFTRNGDKHFTLSRSTFIPDWDYEFAGRVTVGQMFDCVNGIEGSYAGPFDWDRAVTVSDPGNLNSRFVTPITGGFTAADIDAFNGADVHSQRWRAQMHSVEMNRRWWSWDVLSTMIGVRYIDYQEDYAFSSTHATNGNGLFSSAIDNRVIGPQVGADFFYPMSLRTSMAFKAKGGIFANFAESRTVLTNDGTNVIFAGDSHVDWAGIVEFGMYGVYHLVPSIRLTAGYEFWYLPGMATVPEQNPHIVALSSGSSIQNEDNVFIHGATVGVQILF